MTASILKLFLYLMLEDYVLAKRIENDDAVWYPISTIMPLTG